MKKVLAVLAFVFVGLLSLVSCGGKDNGVEVYKLETTFGSADYNNMTKTLYLLDDDDYALLVYSTDSQNKEQPTADFRMVGKYTKEGTQVTLELGEGYFKAWQGSQVALDTPFAGETGRGFYNMVVGETFTLTCENGKLIIPVEE